MKINRRDQLEALIAFFQLDSGVVIGNPGVGKSFLMSEMVSELLDRGIPSTMVRLDFLKEGTDAEIAKSLQMNDDLWIESLERIVLPSNTRGVIVFDAFDAVKDEKLMTAILNQVRELKRRLHGWSIVVSVRTYDAARSPRLIDLFPQVTPSDEIQCRKYEIPVLSEPELEGFLATNEKINRIFQAGSPKLKEILRIPFYLYLLDIILSKTDTSTDTVTALKSEIELLDLYWIKVVYKISPVTHTESSLRKLSNQMVRNRVLSADKATYVDSLSDGQIKVFEDLLSERVLVEQNMYGAQIAYAHNILFDYAVGRLLLKDSFGALLSFIKEDPTRPFFLRPSFVYFFARLWYVDQRKFWAIYDELSQDADELVRLFTKLIPSAVLAKEFEDITQLNFFSGENSYKTDQIQNVLQATIYTDRTDNISSQAALVLVLSKQIKPEFAGTLFVVLEKLVENAKFKEDDEFKNSCGEASRNLQNFLLANNGFPGFEHLASTRGIDLVAKTYSTDIAASRALLEPILEKMDSPGFNISYLVSLSDALKYLFDSDPEFTARVYEKIFLHDENSDESVPLHSGVMMSMTSNRRDQFGLCYSYLKQMFPRFLRLRPDLVIPLGIRLCNESFRKKNPEEIIPKDSIKVSLKMTINGVKAEYHIDMSHSSGISLHYGNEALQHNELILNYFAGITSENKTDVLAESVKLYVENAQTAHCWAELLKFGARHPKQTKDLLYELLLQPAILFWNDTCVEAGAFLEKIEPYLSGEELLQVETVILSLLDLVNGDDLVWTRRTVLRLLSRVPKSRLSGQEAISIIEESGSVSNDPIVTYESSFEDYTTEMFLENQGVDINTEENQKLIALESKMASICRDYENRFADPKEYKDAFAWASEAFQNIGANDELPEDLVRTVLTSVADVCDLILRSHVQVPDFEPLSANQIAQIKTMVLACLNHYEQKDIDGEENASPSSFGPTPKTNASSSLLFLYEITKDVELPAVIEKYSADKNAVVRFGIMQFLNLLYRSNPDMYWRIIHDRIKNESNWMTKRAMINSLESRRIYDNDQERFLESMELAKAELYGFPKESNTYKDSFLFVALCNLRYTGDKRTEAILLECLEQNLSLGIPLVQQAFEIIEPENFYRNYDDDQDVAKSRLIVSLMMALLEKCEKILGTVQPDSEPDEKVATCFEIINEIILRIYFAMQIFYRVNHGKIKISKEEKKKFYFFCKPMLEKIISISSNLDGGLMQGYSAHHLIGIMDEVLEYDPEFSLETTSAATEMAFRTNYTADYDALNTIVKYTHKLLADHKTLLNNPKAFSQIMDMLNLYVRSGQIKVLEILWKLDEIFR